MAKALVDALVPIFAGLLLGFWADHRGLMDNPRRILRDRIWQII
jgi:hypothetical protein